MLAIMRQALCRGGTLPLSIPAAKIIREDTCDGLLLPLLSGGWHLAIQTARSLRWALGEIAYRARRRIFRPR
jgi:hypothetical protein